MLLQLTFLGTGSAFTDFRVNYHTNGVVETSEGLVLLDCGGTAVQSLKELSYTAQDVVAVLITHMHGDHVGGLEQLVFERFYTGGPAWNRTRILAATDVHPSIRQYLNPMVNELTLRDGKLYSGGFDYLVSTVADQWFQVGGVTFTLHETPHVDGPGVRKPAYGVEVEKEGSSFYWTADTTFRSDIGDLFPDAEIIFHDCTFMPVYPGTVHTHYEELLTLPDAVRARIVLMHHTVVPDGIDVVADGFREAGSRHGVFEIG